MRVTATPDRANLAPMENKSSVNTLSKTKKTYAHDKANLAPIKKKSSVNTLKSVHLCVFRVFVRGLEANELLCE